VPENAAGEELAEPLFHELWQAVAVAPRGGFAQKGFEVGADHGVEDAALGLAGPVAHAFEKHVFHVRPARAP